MNVNDVYRIMRFIARKNQLASLSPQDFQDSFNSAQRNYYDFLVGRLEQYRYDSPKPRVGVAMTDNVVSRLTPFQQSDSLAVVVGVVTVVVPDVQVVAVLVALIIVILVVVVFANPALGTNLNLLPTTDCDASVAKSPANEGTVEVVEFIELVSVTINVPTFLFERTAVYPKVTLYVGFVLGLIKISPV